MVENLIILIIVKLYEFLKKKYPNGQIKNYAIIEMDKLDETIDKTKLDQLTSEEVKTLIKTDLKNHVDNFIDGFKKTREEKKGKK